jgi:hypothetical protein
MIPARDVLQLFRHLFESGSDKGVREVLRASLMPEQALLHAIECNGALIDL